MTALADAPALPQGVSLFGLDGPPVLGSTTPRLWTRPLITGAPGPCGCGCALTPATSYGFAVIEFARDVLATPLDPWEAWLAIHAGELLPDGRPRFRTVLVIVARQQGKTFLLQVLTLFWLFVERQKFILGTSTNLDYARESWLATVARAQDAEELAEEIAYGGVREANGQECLTTVDKCRYKIAASNRRGGRSLTINRLILDELREHQTWDAWNAATKAQNAVMDAQAFAITNQGDDKSVVLDALREPALEYISTGVGDPRLGMFEWSSPDDADPTDLHALAQANPNLGRRTDPDALLGDAVRAKRAGGDELAGFRTEVMCQRVALLNPAVDPSYWRACAEPDMTLEALREQIVLCVDVSYDDHHVTLAAAAPGVDGVVHGEIMGAWSSTAAARTEIRELCQQLRPRALGWFPSGPATILGADVKALHKDGLVGRKLYLTSDEMREEAPGVVALVDREASAACQSLADYVKNRAFVHPDDELLNAHIEASTRQDNGDGWRFARRGSKRNDAAYAMAGAVHLARTLPRVETYNVLDSVF